MKLDTTRVSSPAQSRTQKVYRHTSPRHNSVVVVGVGYVGLPLALRAAEKGFTVFGYDVDHEKIEHLKRGVAPYVTKAEQQLLSLPQFVPTTDETDIQSAETYILCVPTPVGKSHIPNLAPLRSAAAVVGTHMTRGSLVVVESTVNPGVCEEVVLSILEKKSGLTVEKDFYFAHCPERINPGDTTWNVTTLPRVIGASGHRSLTKAEELYGRIIEAPLQRMSSIKEAEAVKMVENAFRDINIAFVNELAMAFDRAGIDLVNVIEGAATKPFSFMPHTPGCGVGGHCIPVDPYYLIRYGETNNFVHRFLKTARVINNSMPQYTVRRLQEALAQIDVPISRARVALLGLAYKRDIPDMRESPALVIERLLRAKGATVHTFDPYVKEASTSASLDDAIENVDAVIIATNHTDFEHLSPKEFERAGVRIVIDGRNCLDKEAFSKSVVIYRGIGR